MDRAEGSSRNIMGTISAPLGGRRRGEASRKVTEDLVGHIADQVSMNMKIDAADHVVTLDNVVGKERLFYIGMTTDLAAKYPINFILKKSFSVENTNPMPMLTPPKETPDKNQLSFTASPINTESPAAQKTMSCDGNTPPTQAQTAIHIKESEASLLAKRSLDFSKDDPDSSARSNELHSIHVKRQKQDNADNITMDNLEQAE